MSDKIGILSEQNQQLITEALENTKARLDMIMMEVLKDVYHRLPFETEIILSNGEIAIIKKFIDPRINSDGIPQAYFDVVEKNNNWHLEFTIKQTGWGGIPK